MYVILLDDQVDAWASWAKERGHSSPFQLECLAAEVKRLRSLLATSPDGTVRLLYPDGSFRDVTPTEMLPVMDNYGEAVSRETLTSFGWERARIDGAEMDVAQDWNLEDRAPCSEWITVRIETYAEEAARERAARLEAERQRDEARAEVERLKDELDASRVKSEPALSLCHGFEERPWED